MQLSHQIASVLVTGRCILATPSQGGNVSAEFLPSRVISKLKAR